MTFEVGDKVIYPNHGLGIVERIEEKTILGTTCGFYHLRIVANVQGENDGCFYLLGQWPHIGFRPHIQVK